MFYEKGNVFVVLKIKHVNTETQENSTQQL